MRTKTEVIQIPSPPAFVDAVDSYAISKGWGRGENGHGARAGFGLAALQFAMENEKKFEAWRKKKIKQDLT